MTTSPTTTRPPSASVTAPFVPADSRRPPMRRGGLFAGRPRDAQTLFARAHTVHLAGVCAQRPILRALHAVVLGGRLYFHGAKAGEKMTLIDQHVVVSASEIVADVPSYAFDAERACPATTFYRAAQAEGTLTLCTDIAIKARVFSLFMDKYQPEGGFAPIDPADPRYAGALAGVQVFSLSLDDAVVKLKWGQNKDAALIQKTVRTLWRRGRPSDIDAVEDMCTFAGEAVRPEFLRHGALTLHVAPRERDVEDAVALCAGAYWNHNVSVDTLVRALRASAWVGAKDEAGTLVATARAVSDNGKLAMIFDVSVAPAIRGRGLGTTLMRLLLDHPRVRDANKVTLGTKDAQTFYARLGFVRTGVTRSHRPLHADAFVSEELCLERNDDGSRA